MTKKVVNGLAWQEYQICVQELVRSWVGVGLESKRGREGRFRGKYNYGVASNPWATTKRNLYFIQFFLA